MNKTHLAAAVMALGSLAVTATAGAQQAAIPSPFHAGQWGIEAYADVFGHGGVMRFFTPRTALVFDLGANHADSKAANSNATLQKSTTNTFDLELGLRHLTMLAPKIASTFGAGVNAGTTQRRDEYVGFPSITVSSYQANYAGAFIEMGGQYIIADRFAVGLAYYLSARRTSTNAGDQRGFAYSTSFRPLRATLYF
ncbi:MAG: hypothetical protein ACJ79K_17415 [Gemmatimonadaceae bacterium]